MVVRLTVGLVLTVVALAIAGRRLWWLWRLAMSGQPAPERVAAVREHPGRDVETQAAEVIGQRKLLKWSVPGVAHALTFWGFIVLLLTIIEAYGALFSRTFAIPGIGHWAFIGFIEDLFAVAVLAAIITFTVIRVRNSPERRGRASAPWLLAGSDEARGKLPDAVKAEAARPLVGTKDEGGVIDPDVIWSCTNCGACVEECPVDIEHIDHIDGMRAYQVLIESAFPVEAAGMLKNLETKGDPWGMGEARRAEWMTELDFEVPIAEGKLDPDVEYLFWVGCAGALEDRAKRTTKAIAALPHGAGVKFAVLGPAETCTGDPARRIGNEFLYQMLAQQNIETLNQAAPRTIVASCPHCFNTIAN